MTTTRSRATAACALLASAVLVLTACGTESDSGTEDDSGTSSKASSNASPKASAEKSASSPAVTEGGATQNVSETLRFTGTTVDGKPFDAATLAGRPTVLWFWAPWCPTCKGQAAETAKVAEDFDGKAHVVGVAGLDKQKAMADFVSDTKVDGFPQLNDERGDIWRKFKITEQSVYVILDEDGKETFTGVLPAGKGLADKLDQLVG
ncbi:redoxin domain-containing protein [Streptomyces sp. E11-3]|uniref:redoxin domain-containing protein n=1 Tax=Streptomyces sp. E11-3 TaxID=3110112 RepID=UPI003980B864